MESLAHILVIDDYREIRDLLARYLAKHGFRVSTAESAARARRRGQSSRMSAMAAAGMIAPG
jgi:two-component system OmpR family response regulator